MRIQRLGDDARDWAMYGSRHAIQVERYFRRSSQLDDTVLFYHLEPGAEEGMHVHLDDDPDSCSDSSDEIYIITRGEVVMITPDARTTLRPGDAAYAPHGWAHGVANESDQPAELIIVFGPPRAASV